MPKKDIKFYVMYGVLAVFFVGFLLAPLGLLLGRSFQTSTGIGLDNYQTVLSIEGLVGAIRNSIVIATCSGLLATVLGFLLAYTLHFTNVCEPIKKFIKTGITLPMLLPTITYGFVIIYSFGKQGLITKLFGRELMEIYGFKGLLIGYVIYTLPSAFLLINNSFRYVDPKYMVVSKLMGDSPIRSFITTVVRPLVGTLGGAFVLSFVLSFTDFGVPASVGGTYEVLATQLYQQMLGSIPSLSNGSVIAVMMLLPAVFSLILLTYLERYNIRYDKVTPMEMAKNKKRDVLFGGISTALVVMILGIFVVMFITPFMNNWPYDMSLTLKYWIKTLTTGNLWQVYGNSLVVAFLTAIAGTFVAYCAGLLAARSTVCTHAKMSIDTVSMITNCVPGMVLGLGYLVFFNNSSLKGGILILVLCNIVHFFTTPYMMAKNALSKMNSSWEATGELMGDRWIQTILRVIIPNSFATLIEMFQYYFVNAMVTISAIIFLTSARTSVVTSKIKELQHYAKFNEIFVLSILIFVTNCVVKRCCDIDPMGRNFKDEEV
ncbi:MAG: ABC transporter permease subunit [Cellulosilyticaceae bacterium]